jgi:hypothetical protein
MCAMEEFRCPYSLDSAVARLTVSKQLLWMNGMKRQPSGRIELQTHYAVAKDDRLSTTRTTIIRVAGIACLLLFLAVTWMALNVRLDLCGEEVIAGLPSPDGKHVAVTYVKETRKVLKEREPMGHMGQRFFGAPNSLRATLNPSPTPLARPSIRSL